MKHYSIIKNTVFFILLSFLALQSCKDDEPEITEETTGTMDITFEHVWGHDLAEFKLNTVLKHPMTGDTITVTKLKYYISNVALKKADGTWWKAPESYHLIDVAHAMHHGTKIKIDKIPSGDYVGIKYLYGVDSLRNYSGAQEGALSVSNGMFWSWNSGYIMLKIEGTSPQSSTGDFAFHLGGYQGEFAVPHWREFEFGKVVATVNENTNPNVHFAANPARLWHTNGTLANSSKMHLPGEVAKTMTSDFYTWTRLEHVHP